MMLYCFRNSFLKLTFGDRNINNRNVPHIEISYSDSPHVLQTVSEENVNPWNILR